MKRYLIIFAVLSLVGAFIAGTVYLMGAPGFILLISLYALFRYMQYGFEKVIKMVVESHERLHKNDEQIYKRLKSIEESRRGR